jgi:hypothetical protein
LHLIRTQNFDGTQNVGAIVAAGDDHLEARRAAADDKRAAVATSGRSQLRAGMPLLTDLGAVLSNMSLPPRV